MEEIEPADFTDFSIVESDQGTDLDMSITPDFAMCKDCRTELFDHNDRRFQYAFITCTHCGPRYSIMEGLPYDRPQTTMSEFDFCDDCSLEYNNPLDRRYYSQTNSCHECGVTMRLINAAGLEYTNEQDILERVQNDLASGATVAVKGIGGYLLLCDATSEAAVMQLRDRKGRPHKPFAVLYPDLEMLSGDTRLSDKEIGLLTGPVAPIVLARLKDELKTGVCLEAVAPGLNQLGVMLPYAPLLQLIATRFNKPLVATSANLSGSPIVFQDDEARNALFAFADLILSHNRRITTNQDDSVMKYTALARQPIVIRRSRGLAPNYYHSLDITDRTSILALGAEMKGSYSFNVGSNLYVAQFLGNLSSYESQVNYRQTLEHFLSLTKCKPAAIIADLHPEYFTSYQANDLSKSFQVPVHRVQHHEAHFTAVLTENDLLDTQEKVLGMIWDGTGYGHDKQIWGGEFFAYEDRAIIRNTHFDYFPVLAADKMALEPRLSAFSITSGHERLEGYFTTQEWSFYHKSILQKGIQTSSMGRMFDAIACLLGLLDKSTYEGQAAMLLEQAAGEYLEEHWYKVEPYDLSILDSILSVKPMLNAIIDDLENNVSVGKIAARFHLTLVRAIEMVAEHGSYQKLAFSGGVFQNGVLVDLIKLHLDDKYQLYFHKQLSPNDENISFGQLMYHLHGLGHNRKLKKEHSLNLV